MLRRPLALLLLAVATIAAGAARAVETLPQRSAELRCLTPTQDRPPPLIYPAGALARLAPGTVRIELTFAVPDAPPEVRLAVGKPVAARRPFLDWLEGLTLDLKPQQQALVLGDEFTLTVPCGTLDL